MDLNAQLVELKSTLEESLKKHASSEIAEQLKEITEKLTGIETELKATPNEDKIKTLENTIADLKGDYAAAVRGLEILSARVKSPVNKSEEKMTLEKSIETALDENHDNVQKFLRGENKRVVLDLKAVADFSTANVTGGTVYGAIYRPGIIQNPNQIGHIRQWITPMSAGAGTDYYFMRENGAGEGAPAPTSEKKATEATTQATGLKPQFDLDLAEASVKFETIAGFMLASRKSLNNIPSLMQFLNSRLPEKLMDVEDAQLLYGNGISPNIKGIFETGNHVYATTTATVFAEQLIDGIKQLEDGQKRIASAAWIRPAEYWELFKNKATGGSEEYDLPQNIVFVNGQLYVGGVPVYKTTALADGDYFIGAAGGADLMMQEAMQIEMFNQDGTNVRTNQVTIRIEETLAFPVYGGNYFVVGNSSLS